MPSTGMRNCTLYVPATNRAWQAAEPAKSSEKSSEIGFKKTSVACRKGDEQPQCGCYASVGGARPRWLRRTLVPGGPSVFGHRTFEPRLSAGESNRSEGDARIASASTGDVDIEDAVCHLACICPGSSVHPQRDGARWTRRWCGARAEGWQHSPPVSGAISSKVFPGDWQHGIVHGPRSEFRMPSTGRPMPARHKHSRTSPNVFSRAIVRLQFTMPEIGGAFPRKRAPEP